MIAKPVKRESGSVMPLTTVSSFVSTLLDNSLSIKDRVGTADSTSSDKASSRSMQGFEPPANTCYPGLVAMPHKIDSKVHLEDDAHSRMVYIANLWLSGNILGISPGFLGRWIHGPCVGCNGFLVLA